MSQLAKKHLGELQELMAESLMQQEQLG